MPARARTGLSSAVALSVYGVVAAAVLGSYFLKYPVPEFWAKTAAVLSALWLAHALHSVGRGAVWAAGWASPTDWAGRLGIWNGRMLRAGLGFGVVTFLIIVLGWAVPGKLAVDLRLLLGLLASTSIAAILLRDRSQRLPRRHLAPLALVLLPAAGCVAGFLSSFTPITHYDSLVYHLALPALYLREGRIDAIPLNLYSAFPGACEALFTFILGTLPAPEYTINVFGWLVALGLGAAAAEWTTTLAGRSAGRISLALWWTMPPVLLLSQGAYVDIPLAAATFLALRCFAAGLEDADNGSAFAFAGFFCGLAVSIKYTGGITAILLIPALLSTGRTGKGRLVMLFIAAASILPAPWLLKNAITLGNPVFPFLYTWLGGSAGWTADSAAGYFKVLTEYGGRSNLLVDLLTPWRTAASRGGFDVLGDFGWPLLLFAAAPAAFLTRRKDVRLLACYFLLHAAFWYLSKPVLRFLVPAMPVAVMLSGATLAALLARPERLARSATALLAVAWTVSNVFLYGLAASELKLFSVPFGTVDRETYLQRRLAFYPTFQFVNASATGDDAVLVIGEQRTYHLNARFLASNLFAPSPVSAACNAARTSDDISTFLMENRVTRLIMNEGEVTRLGGLSRFGFSDAGAAALRIFLKERSTVISSDRGVDLYDLSLPVSFGKRP